MLLRLVQLIVYSIGCLSITLGASNAEMIHLMARKGDAEGVLAEVNKGVPIDLPSTKHTTEMGVSPLFVAARFGRTDVVAALIAAGAEIDTFFENEPAAYPAGTALYVASGKGHEAVVDLLLEAGADPAVFDETIGTPLQVALEAGHKGVAVKLIAAGAPERVEAEPINQLIASADVEVGRKEANQCRLCHQLEPTDEPDDTPVAPTLWEIVGRPIGSVADFVYSPAMSSEEGNWTYEALNSYLAAPYLYIPGARMFSFVESDERRAAIIAYLRSLSDDPKPLP